MAAKLVRKLLFCGARSFPAPPELPEGHIWVSVGKEKGKRARFEMEVSHLTHPLFEDFLRESVDEYGYSYEGALRIACEPDLFLHVLEPLRMRSNPSVHHLEHTVDGIYGVNADKQSQPQHRLKER